MKVLDKLISEGVIPFDMGKELKDAFEAKVFERSEKEIERREMEILQEAKEQYLKVIAEKEEEYKKKYEEQLQKLEEKSQEYSDFMESKLNNYVDYVVEQFIKENSQAIKSQVVVEKYEAMIEAFQAMLIAGGVEVKQIQEEFESEKESLEESQSRDDLVEEVMNLRKELDKAKKNVIVESLASNLSDFKREKLFKIGKELLESGVDIHSFENQLSIFKDTLEEHVIVDDIKANQSSMLFKSSVFKY